MPERKGASPSGPGCTSWGWIRAPCAWTRSVSARCASTTSSLPKWSERGTSLCRGSTVQAPSVISPTPPFARASKYASVRGEGSPSRVPKPVSIGDITSRLRSSSDPIRIGENRVERALTVLLVR